MLRPSFKPTMRKLALVAAAYRRWGRQVMAIIVKEWRQLLRDRALLSFVIFIFSLDILLAAGAPGFDLHMARLGVIDRDHSLAARDLIYRLRAPYFDVRAVVDDALVLERLLERGQLRAVLIIPHGFERTLVQARQPADLQLVIDASNSNLAYLVTSYSERIIGQWTAARQSPVAVATLRPGGLPQVRLQIHTRFNADLREPWFSTISELLTMITVASILLPAAALTREKERGTIEQLLVSPLTPLQIVSGKIIAMVVVTLLGSAVAIGVVMHGLLDVPFRGQVVLFFAMVALYAMTCAGLGILAATFARNSGQVGLIVLLLVMPIILLSGTWNYIESMPNWLQVLIELSPLHHFVPITYGILLKGADAAAIALPAVKMTLLGAGFLVLGVARFKRQFR
ncbi:MAG: ABC transporter permease [Methylophilaceae bacterium]